LPDPSGWRKIGDVGTVASRCALILVAAAAATACASNSSVQWNHPLVASGLPPAGPVFVMEPAIAGTASPGNIGRDFSSIKRTVLARLLAIVKERHPGAEVAEGGPDGATQMLRGYGTAAGDTGASREEFDAASRAYELGASHLLVPQITEWTEMRTDDPFGAFLGPHNRITVTLRLMRLQPPAVVGVATFRNRARLTLNQPAAGLLNDRFRRVVLRLMSGE